jgi:uncharacterized membrane protein YjjB (DUF3815 family)
VNGISLEGRSVIVAMCVGQLGSLLAHVVVASILAAVLAAGILLGPVALLWSRREVLQP